MTRLLNYIIKFYGPVDQFSMAQNRTIGFDQRD